MTPQVHEAEVDVLQRAVSWRLNPLFLARIAGLPFSSVAQLESEPTFRDVLAIVELNARRRAVALRASDTLALAIHGEENAELRRKLISLRRDTYNERKVHDVSAAAAIPENVRAIISEYVQLTDELGDAKARALASSASALTEAKRGIRRIAANEDFRSGVRLSSVDLDAHLDGYLARPADAPASKRTRHLETTLTQYIYRTACKTSPFSRLTSVSAGRFAGSVEPMASTGVVHTKRSTAQINLAVLGRIASAIQSNSDLVARLPVLMVSSSDLSNTEISYWRRSVRQAANSAGAVTLDTVHESQFTIRTGEVVASISEVLTSPGVTVGMLVARLSHARPDWSKADVHQFVAELLRIGLLVTPSLQIDIHSSNPLDEFCTNVERIDSPVAETVAAGLRRVEQLIALFPDSNPVTRADLLGSIREELADVLRILESATTLPGTVVYEDATIDGLDVVADIDWWKTGPAADLAWVARLIPIFDLNNMRRLVMREYFLKRCGEGGTAPNILTFVHEFDRDFFGNYAQQLLRHRRFGVDGFALVDNWFRQPEITQLDRLRESLRDRMSAALADSEDAAEIRLEECLGADFADRIPETGDTLAPWAFFAQVGNESGTWRTALNRVHSGVGLTFSRFLNVLPDDISDDLRTELSTLTPEGAVLAELTGGYDTTNLNLHPVLLPYEIVCPGQYSSRPSNEQIAVDSLSIRHDTDSGRLMLYSAELDREVIPIYQGFLVPMALPEVQNILLNFSYPGPVTLDFWSGVTGEEDRIQRFPRLLVGTTVVSRTSWRVPVDQWPSFDLAGSAEEYYCRWVEWAQDAEFPRRLFIQVPGETKPLYIDQASPLSVVTVGIVTRAVSSAITLTEMFPDPDALWMRDAEGDSYVTELTVELNGRRDS